MPKKEEPKKKVVVVEEVEMNDEPVVVEESPKEEAKTETPVQNVEKEQVFTDDLEEFEKPNYLWIIIPTALLVGALVGGLITYFSGISALSVSKASPSPVASSVPDTESTPAPEPKSDVDRSEVKLQVLNGSGVSGLAGKAKTYLEGLGYKDVTVGNASVSNLTETTIAVKKDKESLLDTVTSDLSKNYKVAADSETLPASSKYDFVITLGSK